MHLVCYFYSYLFTGLCLYGTNHVTTDIIVFTRA